MYILYKIVAHMKIQEFQENSGDCGDCGQYDLLYTYGAIAQAWYILRPACVE